MANVKLRDLTDQEQAAVTPDAQRLMQIEQEKQEIQLRLYRLAVAFAGDNVEGVRLDLGEMALYHDKKQRRKRAAAK